MTKLMRQILEEKAEGRRHLAALPISQKIAKLEKLRERRELIASSSLRRQSPRKVPDRWRALVP